MQSQTWKSPAPSAMKIPPLSPQQKYRARIYASVLLVAVMTGALWTGWRFYSTYAALKHQFAVDDEHPEPGTWAIERERWEAKLERMRKVGWEHDDGYYFGRLGTKDEAVFLIRKLPRGMTDLNGCLGSQGHQHLSYGLALMTNQDLGPTSDAWIDWLAANKDNSQAEWILDGFKRAGVSLDGPSRDHSRWSAEGQPKKAQALEVFRRVGIHTEWHEARYGGQQDNQKTTASEPADALKEHLIYNAFRLLRDCGFDATTLRAEDLAGPESAHILQGALQYAKFLSTRDLYGPLGHVFDHPNGIMFDNDSRPPPHIVTERWIMWVWWGIVTAVEFACLLGLRRLWRRKK